MKNTPVHINSKNFQNYIETDSVFIGLRHDDVIHVYFKANTQIDKYFQHWLLIVYNYLCGEKKYPFLIEGGEFVDITKDGKKYAEEIASEIPLTCEAILVKNSAQLIIASFFIRFSKLPFEIKIFKNFDKALIWCKTCELVSK